MGNPIAETGIDPRELNPVLGVADEGRSDSGTEQTDFDTAWNITEGLQYYSEEERQILADQAAQAAYNDVPEAYRSPFIYNAVRYASQLAMGLKPLPEEEGDQS